MQLYIKKKKVHCDQLDFTSGYQVSFNIKRSTKLIAM